MFKIKICKNCRKLFFVTHKIGLERIFCCSSCKDKYNSRVRYNRLKNNEEFKLQNYENSKKWRLDNKEHFNNLVRKKSRLFRRKLVKYRRENKLCIECGEFLDTFRSRTRCLEHLLRQENYKNKK